MKTHAARSRSLSRLALGSVCAFAFAMVGADCEGNIVQDPTFRDWCGTSLCSWHTDYGQVARVPTWNADDLGVQFLDNAGGHPPGTQITQVTHETSARCILFTSVGNLAPGAQMTVGVDFNSDGSVETTAPLGAASWQQVQTEITAPAHYTGITFHVTKSGTGTAILAEMRITSTTGCTAAPAAVHDLLLGEACTTSQDCAAGLVCSGQSAGALSLCGQCNAQTPCPGGAACGSRGAFLPLQCDLGLGKAPVAAPCIADSDCASGSCAGARAVPLLGGDAGSCDLNTIGPSSPADCSWFTAIGGSCR